MQGNALKLAAPASAAIALAALIVTTAISGPAAAPP
jgi:hypothetical protein